MSRTSQQLKLLKDSILRNFDKQIAEIGLNLLFVGDAKNVAALSSHSHERRPPRCDGGGDCEEVARTLKGRERDLRHVHNAVSFESKSFLFSFPTSRNQTHCHLIMGKCHCLPS